MDDDRGSFNGRKRMDHKSKREKKERKRIKISKKQKIQQQNCNHVKTNNKENLIPSTGPVNGRRRVRTTTHTNIRKATADIISVKRWRNRIRLARVQTNEKKRRKKEDRRLDESDRVAKKQASIKTGWYWLFEAKLWNKWWFEWKGEMKTNNNEKLRKREAKIAAKKVTTRRKNVWKMGCRPKNCSDKSEKTPTQEIKYN